MLGIFPPTSESEHINYFSYVISVLLNNKRITMNCTFLVLSTHHVIANVEYFGPSELSYLNSL